MTSLEPRKVTDEVVSTYFAINSSPTIVGFGSLISEKSSRTTFPDLKNFRYVRVHGYRRVFSHPAAIFFERGIADLSTKRIASLSIEKASGGSFIGTAFEVSNKEGPDMFIKREEEFGFELIDFEPIHFSDSNNSNSLTGLACVASNDETYISRWGMERFIQRYVSEGINSIWGWNHPDSEILPCSIYLRHVYLACQSAGEDVLSSFLDQTYLVDRVTTIRNYIDKNPDILLLVPPESLRERYNG
jgi:hypothetical protein